jgi:hypothetical protein
VATLYWGAENVLLSQLSKKNPTVAAVVGSTPGLIVVVSVGGFVTGGFVVVFGAGSSFLHEIIRLTEATKAIAINFTK